MFWLRSCPTCGGDLYLANGEDAALCVQCGRPTAVRVIADQMREAVAA